MSDIIQLLPDSVASQIAAGEVIQRPASAVKEMMENAVDSGATAIGLIVKDAGRTLIQVTDNGCGMTETDARMSFERHATSKIRKVEDIFTIRTRGFRGEALASIAAVAQVEMQTKLTGSELGTRILIEGSEVKAHEACQCREGTSISIKNLFFNVPARRNFLKSNASETRHIIDEFQRIALSHPEISFTMHQNGLETFNLAAGPLRQRIVSIFGSNYNERLTPVSEETNIITISGYVSKPEFAKKTRGEQFFFVNRRYVRDHYLHHAVMNAYDQLLQHGSFPSYFLFIEIDPAKIDVNIHPTKTEIKFEDERSVYAIMKASVKRSLGQFGVAPLLDFEEEKGFVIPAEKYNEIPQQPQIKVNPRFNPFDTSPAPARQASPSFPYSKERNQQSVQNWEKLYGGLENESLPEQQLLSKEWKEDALAETETNLIQLHNRYIVAPSKSGLLIIDQQTAHEKVLYERYLTAINSNRADTQQELFPKAIEFSSPDFELLKELEEEIRLLGFDIREFGKNTFVIHGTPADIVQGEEKEILESLLDQYKHNASGMQLSKRENLARALAKKLAVKPGKVLSQKEMMNLIRDLFSCKDPNAVPGGKSPVVILPVEEISRRMGK